MQSLWRGYLERKHYTFQKTLSSPKHHYFSASELRETLTSKKLPFFPNTPPRTASYKYSNGGVYTGEWLGGFRHGTGVMTWPDKCVYSGAWSYGYPCGHGKFTYIDKDVFEGVWRSYFTVKPNKNMEGYSWLSYKHENLTNFENNHTVMVKYLNDKFSEILQEIKEATKRIDEMFAHLRATIAVELYEGITFQGSLHEGKRQGYGRNVWGNGDVYEGDWESDAQNGWGRNLWIDGSRYIGCYLNNQKHGLGEYIWDDSTSYIGEWRENIINGVGKYSWGDGRQYLGEWSQGMMSGFGVFMWKDGRKYEGFWNKGRKEGIGISFVADGSSRTDLWLAGKIVKKE